MTRFLQTAMTVLLSSLALVPRCAAFQPEPLAIDVQDGGGAVNILTSNTAARPAVVVRGRNNEPVEGVVVTFTLPKSGTRATFEGGRGEFTVKTGPDGRAISSDMRPIGLGFFQIEIKAEFQGRTASAVITQKNVLNASDATPSELAQAGGDERNVFRIEVLEGDDGVNIINKKTAVRSVVRIVDRNNLPVAGAAVAFAVVATRGPRAEFNGAQKSVSVVTGSDGRAEANLVNPQGKGAFHIQIQATVQGQAITRTIVQTNFSTVAAAAKAGKIPGSSAPAEGSTATASGSTSTTAASSTAAGSSAASSAAAGATAGAAAGTSAGLSGLAIAGLAGAVGAAGLGVAKATGALGGNSSSQTNCDSLANQAVSSLQNGIQLCSSATTQTQISQCQSTLQSALSVAGNYCSCFRNAGGTFTADQRQLFQLATTLARSTNINASVFSSCQ